MNLPPHKIIFKDERSILVEFEIGDGLKPLRQLYTNEEHATMQELEVDAHLLLNEVGDVTGVVPHDLLEMHGGLENYKEFIAEQIGATVVPCVIVPWGYSHVDGSA